MTYASPRASVASCAVRARSRSRPGMLQSVCVARSGYIIASMAAEPAPEQPSPRLASQYVATRAGERCARRVEDDRIGAARALVLETKRRMRGWNEAGYQQTKAMRFKRRRTAEA